MNAQFNPPIADARGVHRPDALPQARDDAYPDLVALLWAVRESLEVALFKLAEVRLIVSTGSARWLARADAELRAALDGLETIEVLRAAEVDELARSLGNPHAPTLGQIAAAAPEPWPDLLAEHRAGLARVLIEIDLVVGENRRLLSAGLNEHSPEAQLARRPLRGPVSDPATRANFQSALATTASFPQLSLQEFLA